MEAGIAAGTETGIEIGIGTVTRGEIGTETIGEETEVNSCDKMEDRI